MNSFGRLFSHNDNIYLIKREISYLMFLDGKDVELEWVKDFRDHLCCDHVLRIGEKFIFCQEVTEVECEVVEE